MAIAGQQSLSVFRWPMYELRDLKRSSPAVCKMQPTVGHALKSVLVPRLGDDTQTAFGNDARGLFLLLQLR